jgi:hypothetical protein
MEKSALDMSDAGSLTAGSLAQDAVTGSSESAARSGNFRTYLMART